MVELFSWLKLRVKRPTGGERFLYSTIILHWNYNYIPPIILLLWTILRRPELFTYVHTITFLGDDSDGTPHPC